MKRLHQFLRKRIEELLGDSQLSFSKSHRTFFRTTGRQETDLRYRLVTLANQNGFPPYEAVRRDPEELNRPAGHTAILQWGPGDSNQSILRTKTGTSPGCFQLFPVCHWLGVAPR